jgi:hypothetical protein
MVEDVMNHDTPNAKKPDDARRRQRTKNLVVMGILVGFVVLIYFVTLVRMGGG